jgi:chemotaxis protein MotB
MAGLLDVVSDREGIRIDGDRFVLPSEVLFPVGSAVLSQEGRDQIQRITLLLSDIAEEIPPSVDWVVRVDGHTDDRPLSGFGRYRNNWELSQARALSVVQYMTGELGFPPERLVPAGFGEFRPIDPAPTPEARAQNRRIELKLTER